MEACNFRDRINNRSSACDNVKKGGSVKIFGKFF